MQMQPSPGNWSLGIDIGGSSVKMALVKAGTEPQTWRSKPHEKPSLEVLSKSIVESFTQLLKEANADREAIGSVGVSIAGPMDDQGVIEMAANVPALGGVSVPKWIEDVLGLGVPVVTVTDANAAAACEHRRNPMPGRSLYLSLGTGVGGAVLDDGKPVIITRGTSGHFGHMDVSGGDPDAPVTQGSGRGALEGYVGFRTLEAAGVPFDSDDRFEHPAMKRALKALAQGIRILLALYRPDHIVLMGGTVNLFSPAIQQVQDSVNDGLTLAAPRPGDWTLTVGGSDNFAAAIGAAAISEIDKQ